MKTDHLVDYLNTLLRVGEIPDESQNGLQVANRGEVHTVGLAVDACLETYRRAAEEGVDLLIVHHGIFWGKPVPISGIHYERMRSLLESNIALYAAHLPLDLHPVFGNNAQIAESMGWSVTGEFGEYHGSVLGKEVLFETPVPLHDLVESIRAKLDCPVRAWEFGPPEIRRLAFVSGGGVGMLEEAVGKGVDAYFTGEPKHSAYWTAREAGMHVLFGGHYATETLGVKAVGRKLQEEFGLNAVFLDAPTGH